MNDRFGSTGLLEAIAAFLAEFPGVLGVYAKDLITGEEIGHRADAIMPTASAIKVGIMAELYRQFATGEVDPARRLTLTAADRIGGTGVLNDLAPGLMPTIADLCHLMARLATTCWLFRNPDTGGKFRNGLGENPQDGSAPRRRRRP